VQPTAIATEQRRRGLSWIVVAAVATVSALLSLPLAFVHLREKPLTPALVRFQVLAPGPDIAVGGTYVSPDGRRIAFSATGPDGRNVLWVRTLDSLDSRSIAATEGFESPPFWSPDSRFIAFEAAGKLRKVEASGGPAQTICDVPDLWRGGAWSREGVIIFGTGTQGLMRISEGAGIVSPLTKLDFSRRELFHMSPVFLPDGRHFLYVPPSTGDSGGIYIGSLDEKPDQQNPKRLVATGSSVIYAPSLGSGSVSSRIGHILFVREGTLMAQAFDVGRLKLAGEAVPIAENFSDTGFPRYSVSTTGVLAYNTGGFRGGNPDTQLTWFDRSGKTLGTLGGPGHYNTLSLSPDGTRVVFSRTSSQAGETSGRPPNYDLWIHEFSRNTSTQITFDPTINWQAVWSADGSRIIFASDRDGPFNLYQKDSSGAGKEDLHFKSSDGKMPYDWSPDGRFLLYVNTTGLRGKLWFLPLAGDDRKPAPYLETDANESHARFSPDGRYVAYTSNTSGVNDVYVQPFPLASTGKWKIGNGSQPHWRRDGKELFYLSNDSKLMAVDTTTNPAFQVGAPKVLFTVPIWGGARFVTRYDVTGDGKRFLVNALTSETTASASTPITVVLNWQAGLKK